MNHIYTIYKATNILNGKGYIGFDSNWPDRQKAHIGAARRRETNYLIHKAIRKYSPNSFQWDILYQSWDPKHTLNEMEDYFIKEYHTHWTEGGYNMVWGGCKTLLGRHHTLVTKRKMSKSAKGKSKSPEARKNMSIAAKKRCQNIKERCRMTLLAANMKGRKWGDGKHKKAASHK